MSGIRLSGLSAADIARIAAAITADGWQTVTGHAVFQPANLGVIVSNLSPIGTLFWEPPAGIKALVRAFTATVDPVDPFVDNGTGGVPTGVGIGWRVQAAQGFALRLTTFARWNTRLQWGSGDFAVATDSAGATNNSVAETGTFVLAGVDVLVAGSLARNLRAFCDGAAGSTVKGSMYYSFEYRVIA